jgi:single-strand DNA-binding protein
MYVNLVGNVGNDPEKRVTPNGRELYSISVAYTDFNGGDKESVWVKVTLSKALEKVIPFIKKGSKIFITGKMGTPRVSAKNGKAYLDVYAYQVELLDKKENQDKPSYQQLSQGDYETTPF